MEALASKILTLHRFKGEDYIEKYELVSEKSFNGKNINEEQTTCEEGTTEINCIKANIKENLLKYRIDKSLFMNVPRFYIFNNEELEKLLEYMPQNLEELRKLKILESIKVKCHGKEIVEIIKNNLI